MLKRKDYNKITKTKREVNCGYLANVPINEDVATIEISVNDAWVVCMEIL